MPEGQRCNYIEKENVTQTEKGNVIYTKKGNVIHTKEENVIHTKEENVIHTEKTNVKGDEMDFIQLNKIIKEVYSSLEKNNFKTLGEEKEPLFEEPMVGVVSGDDEYYPFLKKHIGEFFWSPKQVLGLKYDTDKVEDENIRVISMVFPQTEKTRLAQRKVKEFPSDRWIVTRGEWEPLMREFSGKLVKALEEKGYKAVSIDLQPEFQRETSTNLGIASRWSHRHSVYAAGLGTFGLSDGIITEKGMAVRLSTTVIEINSEKDDLPPTCTPKTRMGHYDWCLFYQNGSCGACIGRCPCDSISKEGHDKKICSDYENTCEENNLAPKEIEKIDRTNYIFGCGICQAKVPCEYKRP